MVNVLSSHLYDKWRKVIVLLTKYENMTNKNLQIYTMNIRIVHGIRQKTYLSKRTQKFEIGL
jgi:hypothetical protein